MTKEMDQVLATVDMQENVEMKNALERLEKNPDFKKVIIDGYLNKKILESVSLLAVPAIIQGNHRSLVMEDLVAASTLKYYFQMIKNIGSVAETDLTDMTEEEFEELA